MKKRSIFIVCFSAVFLFSGIQEAQCARPSRSKPPIQQPTPPDLTVTVKFGDVISFKNSKGFMCYSPRPIFTIKNTGQATAKGFYYVIEWKNNPSHVWQMYSGGSNNSLVGGATKTIDYSNSPLADQWWCVNETNWKPGWRIKADTKNAVTESNEGNNVAEKIFVPLSISPTAPPRAIQRDYQKIPTPR